MKPQGRPRDFEHWTGETRRYDLVKELVVALAVVSVLTVALAALLSSPDEKQITLQRWAQAAPADFLATAATELDRTSATATYGPPYSDTAGAAQKIGPIDLQSVPGTTARVDTADDFVVGPLRSVAGAPAVTAALARWSAADEATRQRWAEGYDAALQKAGGDPAATAPGDYGPVPVMLKGLLDLARSGGLDGALLMRSRFYQTDYTRSVLFLADGTYLEDRAVAQHLGGDQWGMMNETGSYPGQPWLWLYSFWYQIKPFSTSGNADALIWAIMMVLSAGLVLVPFLPGIRSIPRWVPVHRLVWRDWYRHGTLPPRVVDLRAQVPDEEPTRPMG